MKIKDAPLTEYVCVWSTGDHQVGGAVCGVLLHPQEARQDRPQRYADLRRGGAPREPDHRGGDGPQGELRVLTCASVAVYGQERMFAPWF